MKLGEFYEKMGADLGEILGRIPSERMIRKFIGKYPQDPSFDQLSQAVEARDWQRAFREAHTLKGVAANLGFEELRQAASDLTEQLRGGVPLRDYQLLEQVRHCQKKLLAMIDALEE